MTDPSMICRNASCICMIDGTEFSKTIMITPTVMRLVPMSMPRAGSSGRIPSGAIISHLPITTFCR